MGESGCSVVEMCAAIKCARSTLEKEWPAAHSEFSAALTQARLASQAGWEATGRDCLVMQPGQGTFQASVWSRSMAARFPDDWRENKGVEVSGSLNLAGELAALNAKAAD